MKSYCKQKAFTLVEVLVSLIILAIGLLGAATLIMYGLQTGQAASQRSAAVVIVQSLAEQMRSNKGMALLDKYNMKFERLDGCIFDKDGNSLANPDAACKKCIDANSDCLADDKVKKDLLDIFDSVNSAMPGSKVLVVRNPNIAGVTGNDELFCLAITWHDQGLGKDKTTDEENILVDTKTPCGESLPSGDTSSYQAWLQL